MLNAKKGEAKGRATNASKGAKPIGEWYGHSKYGPISDEVRMELIRRDEIGRSAIKSDAGEVK